MISTTDLTGTQLEQLEALLADTTPGGGVYRPAVARDTEVLQQLEQAGLARYFEDVTYETYETTDAGRAVVVDRAVEEAEAEAFLREADEAQLREAIGKLKAVFNDLTDLVLRERTLMDIEACQNRLDDLAEGQSESTGRHCLVPVDDRPTQVIPPVQDAEPMSDREADGLAFILAGLAEVEQPRESTEPVQEQTAPMAIAGTLPFIPTPYPRLDQLTAERLLGAIKGSDTGEDVNEATAEQWAELEADLADDRSWLRRKLRPHRAVVLSIVASVVVTWFVAWLVMA